MKTPTGFIDARNCDAFSVKINLLTENIVLFFSPKRVSLSPYCHQFRWMTIVFFSFVYFGHSPSLRLSPPTFATIKDLSSLSHCFTLFFIFALFSLQVSPNDGLPTIVCHMCRAQLDSCQQFRDKAQRSQQKLQNFLQFANKLTGSPQVNDKIYKKKIISKNVRSSHICWPPSHRRAFFTYVLRNEWRKKGILRIGRLK